MLTTNDTNTLHLKFLFPHLLREDGFTDFLGVRDSLLLSLTGLKLIIN